ncbi:MAG: glycosyltransferase family 4 protein [Cyclobacteriaceae bacterium]
MVKVLIDIHYLQVAQTGIKTYIDDLIEISKHSNSEIEYYVAPAVGLVHEKRFYKKGGLIRAMLFHIATFWWFAIGLQREIRRVGADIVVSPNYLGPITRNVKKLVIFHDAFFWINRTHYNTFWLRYFQILIGLGLKGDAEIVTVSNHSKQKIKEHAKTKNKINVLWSIGPQRVDNLESEPISDLQKGAYLLHVGVLEKRKNLLTLIKAFRIFKDQHQNSQMKLVLAGMPGPKRKLDDSDKINRMIAELNLEGDVLLPGYVDTEEKESLYANALAYVFPSFSEGFGYPILEAFSFGLPVIISMDGALTEIGGDAVLRADTMDVGDWAKKIEFVWTQEDVRESLRKKGYERLELFSRENNLKRFEQLLLNSVNGG